uniref:Uncharacterized protein n=1 Tax=Takifugu rubripes TaxID=31033 RepID=A0A3B5JZS3_TAKRU
MPHAVKTTTMASSQSSGEGIMDVGDVRTIPGLLKLGPIVSIQAYELEHAAFWFFEVVLMWFLGAFTFIATFLMAVNLWMSYSVTCGSPHAASTDMLC